MAMIEERAMIKNSMISVVDAIRREFGLCVSSDDSGYYLVLILLKFFDVAVMPAPYVPIEQYPVQFAPSVFVFEYLSCSDSIHLVSFPSNVRNLSMSSLIKSVDELKEEINEYIDNSSDNDIMQIFGYTFAQIPDPDRIKNVYLSSK